jgi:flavin reductase (DIM6/NTAB) family NADH-FMN oxidoreductase RutF
MPIPERAVGPIPTGRDPDEYDRQRRRVLWSMPTGLFVLGTRVGARRNLMTCNWAMQVATVPKLVAVSVEASSVTRTLLDQGGSFSLSILPATERALVRRFAKPVDTMEVDAEGRASSLQGVPVEETAEGLPRLSSALAWLVCSVRHTLDWDQDTPDGASHVLYVGEVIDVGEAPTALPSGPDGGDPEVLQMADTRMNYGG